MASLESLDPEESLVAPLLGVATGSCVGAGCTGGSRITWDPGGHSRFRFSLTAPGNFTVQLADVGKTRSRYAPGPSSAALDVAFDRGQCAGGGVSTFIISGRMSLGPTQPSPR